MKKLSMMDENLAKKARELSITSAMAPSQIYLRLCNLTGGKGLSLIEAEKVLFFEHQIKINHGLDLQELGIAKQNRNSAT